uniref:eEF-1B gamma n=1 Tax=Trichuris muris TaxID=70415 RepID=A0A5S6R414_TRIMR
MAVCGTLFSEPNSFQTKKLLAVAEFGNVNLKTECLSKAKSAHQNPLHTQVYFVSSKGQHLYTPNAIACYLSSALTASKDQFHAVQVVEWLDIADTQFLPHVLSWVLPCVSAVEFNKAKVEEAKKQLAAQLHWLNSVMLSRTFLVGERLSVADVVLACNLLPAFQHVLDEKLRSQYVNVKRWFLTIVNQPFFKKAFGQWELCVKPAEFDPAKYQQFESAVSGKGVPATKKAKKLKEAVAKPAAEPAKAPENDDDLDVPAEPKQKDPFAAFPKGKFDMEAFKRVYSNEDTITKALPYFWEHFDAENYSIWYCEYKYSNELTKVFMSCNLVTGMFQRLDRMRKNAFASVCVFGTDNNASISGIWIWRGHELAFKLSEDWQIDYESYAWTKLDPAEEKTKKLVDEYFAWEGKFGGKAFNQGKIFK